MALIPFKLCLLLTISSLIATQFGFGFGFGTFDSLLAVLVPIFLYATLGGWERIYILLATLPRDATGAIFRVRLLREFKHFNESIKTIPRKFEQIVQRHPNKACFVFENQVYTFAQMSELSTLIAIVLRDQLHVQAKDNVALLMPNKPEYVAIWLGVSKMGGVTALVNTNVRNDSLVHSMKAANCSVLIYDAEYAAAVNEIRAQLPQVGVKHVVQWQKQKQNQPTTTLTPQTAESLDISLQEETEKIKATNPSLIQTFEIYNADNADAVLYIYTSGTTGLPKAAVLRHRRFNHPASGVDIMLLKADDIIYNPLPLYHSSGGILGVGLAIVRGHTVVLRSKFSASQFFDDCIANKCTVAQYIGEMCRYLLAQPERPSDTGHQVRVMIGNGLRQSVWVDLIKRFKIPHIAEFYGATEGNSQLMNYSNKLGACGFLSQVIPQFIDLIKVDRETGVPQRDATGMCIRCKPGEPGQLVGSITSGDKTLSDFAGYTDKTATFKKLIKDVFERGDAAFTSGDILVMDKLGYVYFVDRIGDTYRWKGENVSTTEVESIISEIFGMEEDVVVYGVQVPGLEGKAGMATISNKSGKTDASSDDFKQQIEKRLPHYARPVFIRVVKSVESTGTCKLRKVELKALGFQPDASDVQLLFFNAEKRSYEPITSEIHQKLLNGAIRL